MPIPIEIKGAYPAEMHRRLYEYVWPSEPAWDGGTYGAGAAVRRADSYMKQSTISDQDILKYAD